MPCLIKSFFLKCYFHCLKSNMKKKNFKTLIIYLKCLLRYQHIIFIYRISLSFIYCNRLSLFKSSVYLFLRVTDYLNLYHQFFFCLQYQLFFIYSIILCFFYSIRIILFNIKISSFSNRIILFMSQYNERRRSNQMNQKDSSKRSKQLFQKN